MQLRTTFSSACLVLATLLGPWLPSAASASAETGARPVHVLKDTSVLDERFAGVLEPGVEYRARIEMAKGGVIELVLFAETAPNHVANFVSLARRGYYDGVTFHRVIPGFMAQGGDPTGSGGGGPGYTVRAEFSELRHVRGTLSMARTPDPNSAGSQFFICFAPAPFLDRQYTVFGQVDSGLEVVDAITPRDPQRASTPGDAMKSVTIVEVRSEVARPSAADTTTAPEAGSSAPAPAVPPASGAGNRGSRPRRNKKRRG